MTGGALAELEATRSPNKETDHTRTSKRSKKYLDIPLAGSDSLFLLSELSAETTEKNHEPTSGEKGVLADRSQLIQFIGRLDIRSILTSMTERSLRHLALVMHVSSGDLSFAR